MNDVRCILHWHRWKRLQGERGTWVACTRCRREKHPAAVGWYGRHPG